MSKFRYGLCASPVTVRAHSTGKTCITSEQVALQAATCQHQVLTFKHEDMLVRIETDKHELSSHDTSDPCAVQATPGHHIPTSTKPKPRPSKPLTAYASLSNPAAKPACMPEVMIIQSVICETDPAVLITAKVWHGITLYDSMLVVVPFQVSLLWLDMADGTRGEKHCRSMYKDSAMGK